MTPEEWQRIKPILESALELEPSSRSGFLDSACADNSLRREVESLLASHELAGTHALNADCGPTLPLAEEAHFRFPPGKRIGAYEILEEIAQGGMGVVYRAIRADGQYKQHVALKVVRADLGAELTSTRFRNERQILASLEHPNIAKILDGGTTADGLPYFVMEMIDGLPVTEYCDQQKLSIDARLRIFRTICSAVHYAHQHLVIHRDIKPTNILIDASGTPKLLDFGIAKILDPGGLPENTTLTVAGLWLMTPEYASPEQFRGEPITTATDVYSLGLVLYELLTGHRAYRLANRLPQEIARVITETDPEQPSAAIRRTEAVEHASQHSETLRPEVVSGLRGDSAEKLQRRLRGDLDNIVMKAIRKEPSDRYSSVDQLSEDLRRHLEGLPVLARKSTIGYRIGKYVVRHKVGVSAAALLLLTLIAGLAATIREARIARANQLRAEHRFNDVRQLANSLIFEVHDSIQDLPGATPARKLIVEKAIRYLDSLAQEAGNDSTLQRELAKAYDRVGDVQGNVLHANLGDTPGALSSYGKALAIQESLLKSDPGNAGLKWDMFASYYNIGWCLYAQGHFQDALASLRKSVELAESTAGQTQDPATVDLWAGSHFGIAGVLVQVGDPSGALENYRRASLIRNSARGANPAQDALLRGHLAGDYGGMASVLAMQGHFDLAVESQRKAAEITEELSRAQPTNATLRHFVGESYEGLGSYLAGNGQLDEALAYEQKAQDVFQALIQADPSNVLEPRWLGYSRIHMGDILLKKNLSSDALESYRKALETFDRVAAKAPMNEFILSGMAIGFAGMGTTHATLARNKHLAVPVQIDEWTKARECYRKSADIWADIRARGALAAEDKAKPEQVRQGLAQCDAALVKLGPPA